ncbi:hypothetical protein ACI79J_17735 [Geodermatophilus sp. SYSU D01062]
MPTTRRTTGHLRAAVLVTGVVALTVTTVPSAAASWSEVIVLPEAESAEGIAEGQGATFYAGEAFTGDIYRGDLDAGTAEEFINIPEDDRWALGMDADLRHGLLYVAGGGTGQAYVYDLDTGATVAVYQFAPPSPPGPPFTTIVNDVVVTRAGAWFTDSRNGVLYFVPIDRSGKPGEFRTLTLQGPAADTSGDINLNGIDAVRGGRTLIVAHTDNGALYTVDPQTGASAQIAGADLPGVDGIVLQGRRLWAVQNSENQVTELRLRGDLTSASVREVITSDLFAAPATAIRHDGRLAVVNTHFDTGIPPTADQYEVVLVDD